MCIWGADESTNNCRRTLQLLLRGFQVVVHLLCLVSFQIAIGREQKVVQAKQIVSYVEQHFLRQSHSNSRFVFVEVQKAR